MSSQNARYISRKERSLVSPVSVTETVALKLIFLIGWRCGGETLSWSCLLGRRTCKPAPSSRESQPVNIQVPRHPGRLACAAAVRARSAVALS